MGSTKAFALNDDAPLGKPTATTCCGCSYDGTAAAAAMMVRPLLSRSAHNFCHLQQMSDAVAAASDGGRHDIIRRRRLTTVTGRYHTTATIRRRRRRRAVDAASDGPQAPLLDHRRCPRFLSLVTHILPHGWCSQYCVMPRTSFLLFVDLPRGSNSVEACTTRGVGRAFGQADLRRWGARWWRSWGAWGWWRSWGARGWWRSWGAGHPRCLYYASL